MDTIKHTLTLYPSKSSEITTKSKTFQKIIRLLAEHNSIWQFAIYQSKLFSPLNAIKYILKHLQHTLWTPSSIHLRYPSKSSEIYIKSQTFQKTLSLLVEHNSIWHFAIYQSKDCSQSNIFCIFSTHYGHHQAYTYAYPSKSENYQTSRRTQFNLTLCDLPIKTLLASKRNQIYSEASSTHIMDTIKHTLTLYPSKSSEITTKSKTFQKITDISENYQTSRISEHQTSIQFDTLRLTNQNSSRL